LRRLDVSAFSRRAFLNASLLLLGANRASATPAGQAAPAGGLRGRAVINSCGGFDLPGDRIDKIPAETFCVLYETCGAIPLAAPEGGRVTARLAGTHEG